MRVMFEFMGNQISLLIGTWDGGWYSRCGPCGRYRNKQLPKQEAKGDPPIGPKVMILNYGKSERFPEAFERTLRRMKLANADLRKQLNLEPRI